MVPGGSVLGDLEGVGQLLVGRDGALRDAGHAILPNGVELSQAMPVDRGAVIRDVVGDMNDQLKSRARWLAGSVISSRDASVGD